jgi:hypothetical protein
MPSVTYKQYMIAEYYSIIKMQLHGKNKTLRKNMPNPKNLLVKLLIYLQEASNLQRKIIPKKNNFNCPFCSNIRNFVIFGCYQIPLFF